MPEIDRSLSDCRYENSLIWFSSDNGGPVPAANNFPLRKQHNLRTRKQKQSPLAEAIPATT